MELKEDILKEYDVSNKTLYAEIITILCYIDNQLKHFENGDLDKDNVVLTLKRLHFMILTLKRLKEIVMYDDHI